MDINLPRTHPIRRTGNEALHSDGRPLDYKLYDFWRWSTSDLVSNATRGVLAEFIVASALGLSSDGVRDEWAAYDLVTSDGISVEVKSAAFIQSWAQKRLSTITFHVPKTHAWNPETNTLEGERRRQAQVYVFALLAHQEKATIDPLNVDQWWFYILPTSVLNDRTRSQHSITLRSLEALAGEAVSYHDLRDAIYKAAATP
jgi:hypothetical protein